MGAWKSMWKGGTGPVLGHPPYSLRRDEERSVLRGVDACEVLEGGEESCHL